MAMRLNSLSFPKKFSMRCRHLYISLSMARGLERRGCWEMTILAPRASSSAMMALLSKAMSAISAPKANPSMSGGRPTVSKRCPGRSTKRTRLPSASVSAKILVVMPPFERPIAWFLVPFCTLTVAVDLDDGGINHGVFHVRIIGDGLEQPLPDIRLRPVAEACEDTVPMAERDRQIAPGTSCACDPQHRFHKKSVVLAAAPWIAWLTQTMRLHLRPLGVSQNESFHPTLAQSSSTDENLEG